MFSFRAMRLSQRWVTLSVCLYDTDRCPISYQLGESYTNVFDEVSFLFTT